MVTRNDCASFNSRLPLYLTNIGKIIFFEKHFSNTVHTKNRIFFIVYFENNNNNDSKKKHKKFLIISLIWSF